MARQDNSQVMAILALRAATGVSPEAIADAVASTWHAIDESLRQVIGQRGVAALYGRCLHRVVPRHPWLGELRDGPWTQVDVAALRAVLARQSAPVAADGGGALLRDLDELLDSLLGPVLAEQLLRGVWSHLSGDSPDLPAQDTSQ